MKTDVGYRIRKLRESKDFSQTNIADELGLSASAYSKIETGKTDVSVSRLAEIAKILDVDVSYFFQTISYNKMDDSPQPQQFATKQEVEILRKAITELKNLMERKTKSSSNRSGIKSSKK